MRVLIVGCGYVGLPLALELLRRGHNVYGLRRSGEGKIMLQANGIKPIQLDITIEENVLNVNKKFDWVINCAAPHHPTKELYYSLYYQGTKNLLKWMKLYPVKKYVYTSSTSVYGQDDGSIVTEVSETNPINENARILVDTEKLIFEAIKTDSLPAIIFRTAGIYGPERGYYFKQFINNPAAVSGNPNRYINMVHRDDVVGAIITALESDIRGEVFNLVDNEPVTLYDFYKYLSEQLNKPMPEFVTEILWQTKSRSSTNKRISNAKLVNLLKYTFKYPTFREGFAEEIDKIKNVKYPDKNL